MFGFPLNFIPESLMDNKHDMPALSTGSEMVWHQKGDNPLSSEPKIVYILYQLIYRWSVQERRDSSVLAMEAWYMGLYLLYGVILTTRATSVLRNDRNICK